MKLIILSLMGLVILCSHVSTCSILFLSFLKRQSNLGASYTYLNTNFTRNSMVVIIFVKNVRLKNCGHFKKDPPILFLEYSILFLEHSISPPYSLFGALYSFCRALYFFLRALYFILGASYSFLGALYSFFGALYSFFRASYSFPVAINTNYNAPKKEKDALKIK